MTMGPRLRKFGLTVHVSASVGWLGVIAGFLALAIAGLTSQDDQMVGAAYVAMYWIGWFVLVPLSFASLLTGLVQSLGTSWGLFRHYWVLATLLINVLANIVLVTFMLKLVPSELRSPAPLVHAGAALLLLLVATALSIYKPRGVTPYGWRRQQEERMARRAVSQASRHAHVWVA